jgi:aminoglycoside 6'-N-acetyltransferase
MPAPPSVSIRPMTVHDLAAVGGWLREPHVARWWTPETTPEAEIRRYRRRLGGAASRTVMCMVERDDRPIGWCQWYRWDDYPEEAVAAGARPGELGADYAIGEPDQIGRGVGTAMIGAIVEEVRRHHPGAGLLVAPEAVNVASRRVLEKNGFSLVEERSIPSESHHRPMAIYRLPAAATRRGTAAGRTGGNQ